MRRRSIAMKRLGTQFEQFDSDSIAMIVLEGDQPLGDEAHTGTTTDWSANSSATPTMFGTSRTTGAT